MRALFILAVITSTIAAGGCLIIVNKVHAPAGTEGEGATEGEGVAAGEGEAGEGEGAQSGEGEGVASGEGEGEGAVFGEGEGGDECSSTAQLNLYTRRIEPLVSGAVPTTCNQCHLQGVDLTMYAQNTPCGTMACMINQGAVVLADPPSSPILTFILNSNPQSNLITPAVIQQEHDGMLQWIDWSADCNDTVCGAAPSDPCGTGATELPPPAVLSPINGCDEAGLVQLYDQKVFSWRGRCVSCHAPYGANTDPTTGAIAPKFFYGTAESPEAPDDARFSMYNMIGKGLIDRNSATNSLLLVKPLNNDPTRPHGGGQKFQNTNDQSYKDFLTFIQAYDVCMTDGAQSPPPPVGNAPVVGILSPQNGQNVSAGTVQFRCSATDAEDGNIGASVVWTSSLDGNLGTGCAFNKTITTPLTFRDITATVTDSDGNVSIDRMAFGIQ